MAKHFSKSRTLRFNAVVMALSAAALPVIVANEDLIKATVDPLVYVALMVVMAMANAWLRLITTTEITTKQQD
ncbi:MAG: hypothetical protein PHR16_11895 [Methylovulum sp.]|nr:hypothetical protein [Methylovulum sp.]